MAYFLKQSSKIKNITNISPKPFYMNYIRFEVKKYYQIFNEFEGKHGNLIVTMFTNKYMLWMSKLSR